MEKCSFWAVRILSPLPRASPQETYSFFTENSLVAHLRRELEGSPSGVQEGRVPAFQDSGHGYLQE